MVAAAPAENVVRERPQPGDVVILLGGRTGRDGIGGATGSSKSHNRQSLDHHGQRGAEGQRPGGAEDPAAVPGSGMSPGSSSGATTSAPAAYPWPWVSWRTAWTSTWTQCGRSTTAWTARSWPSPSPRSAWPWWWRRSRRRPLHRRRGGGESGSVPRGGGDGVPPDGDALAGQDHRGPEPGLPEHQRRREARPGGGSRRPVPRPRSAQDCRRLLPPLHSLQT